MVLSALVCDSRFHSSAYRQTSTNEPHTLDLFLCQLLNGFTKAQGTVQLS